MQSLGRNLRTRSKIQPDEIANFHSFRHALALRKLDEGCDIALVSQWLGHAEPAFTAKTYCIQNEQQLEDAFFSTKSNTM